MEFDELTKALSMVRSRIRNAQEASDPLFGEINASSLIINLDTAYNTLTGHKLHAVCPWCHGVLSDQCRGCKGRGLIGEFSWDHTVSSTLKAGRK